MGRGWREARAVLAMPVPRTIGNGESNMNICVPATQDLGLKSPVSAHFGSAPLFIVVDTDTGVCQTIPNLNMHQGHGGCQPLRVLAGHAIDGIVVGGIGMGAMMKLRAAGIRVYMADQATVEEAVAACKAGTLQEADPAQACAHHGHGHDGHGEGHHGPCGS
jgi:predicted Fe-Mo cluster-binding NifX family protein